MIGARKIVLAGTMAALALDCDDDAAADVDTDSDAEDVAVAALLEARDALLDAAFESDLAVVVAAADDAVEEAATVEMDTPDSVARLDRRLEAAEGSSVRVSELAVEVEAAADEDAAAEEEEEAAAEVVEAAVEVEAAAEAMVLTDRLVSVARLDSKLEAAAGSMVVVWVPSVEVGTSVTVTVTTLVSFEAAEVEDLEDAVVVAVSDADMDVEEAE